MAEGYTQEHGTEQQDGVAGQSCRAAAVLVSLAVAPVRAVTVVAIATFHLGTGVATVSFVTESLVGARLEYGV